jgi:hypothetical protein
LGQSAVPVSGPQHIEQSGTSDRPLPAGDGVHRHAAHEIELFQGYPAEPVRFHRPNRDDRDSQVRFEQCQQVFLRRYLMSGCFEDAIRL